MYRYIRYQSDSRLSFTLAVCLAEKTILLLQAAKQIRNKIRIFQQNIGIKEILILVTAKVIVIKSFGGIYLWIWDLGLFGFIVYSLWISFYKYFEEQVGMYFRSIKQIKKLFLRQLFFCEDVEYRKSHKLSIIRKFFTSIMEYWGGNYTRERRYIVLFHDILWIHQFSIQKFKIRCA